MSQNPSPHHAADAVPAGHAADPRSALAALDDIGTVQHARTERLITPRWAWHVQGATFVLIGAGFLLPTTGRMILVFGAAIIGGVVAGALQRKTGHRPTVRTWKDMVAPLSLIVPVLVVAVTCWLVGVLLHWPWVGLIAGVGAYLAVVIAGPAAERRSARK